MGGEERGGELSDGSYWSITNITNPSPSDCPPDGLLKIDLGIHQTYQSIVLSHDDSGNPRVYQDLEESDITVPTLELPGNMNRNHYYSSFHKWLHSLHLDIPLDDDMLWDFTFQLMDCLFGSVVDHLHQKVAICVSADLHRVPIPIEKDDEDDIPMEDEEEDDPMEADEDIEEEYDPIIEEEYEEYDPIEDDDQEISLIKPWVQELSDFYAVVAAEEHRKLGDCLICLDPLISVVVEEEEEEEDGKKNKYVFASPCGHYFHDHCMSKWLTTSDSCPLCRFDISSLIEQ